MPEKQVAPYGSWKSPITSDLIVQGSIGVGSVMLDGEDIYWLEMRPSEGGRSVIVRRAPDGTITDVTPKPFNARTRVHEYGGGDYVVAAGTVYFSNYDDQRLYEQRRNSEPRALTAPVAMRYADPIVDLKRNRLICVREDHTGEGEAANTLVSISLETDSDAKVVASGSDFYSSPRLSPDGTKLAWLSWNHPNMPWDGTQLWVGEIDQDGAVSGNKLIAGGAEESIFQPEWSPDGTLYFVSDRTGWWNLYRDHPTNGIEPLHEMKVEFALPQWVFGMSTYAFETSNRLICSYVNRGNSSLAKLNIDTGDFQDVQTSYTDITSVHAAPSCAVFRGGSPTEAASIVRLDLVTGRADVLRRSNDLGIDSGYLSVPEAIEFPTEDGKTAHAFFYRPKNRDYVAPEGELPMLLVKIHGGPTSAATSGLALGIQYWTSRGIGVLDVNYGGSTGYGREYRMRLNDRWGIVDVDDCVNGAGYLVEQKLVDGNRLVITGGSAGGYTTLCALTFRDRFRAGASHFGVSDCEALVADTHKFESRYLDRLIGPYPERADLYRDRSPIHFVDQLSCPVIFFQGLEDKVVLPNQAEMMVDALRTKGLPVAYVAFEGEQHGFRKAENIKRALDGEFYFYSRVFGFDVADEIEPVKIENL